MLRAFDVLDRHLDLYKNHLLEASAGTGKTFSIQNIVLRLLIEGEGIPIDKILIVTFTRAATKELKHRIRSHIELTIGQLKLASSSPESLVTVPDYLLAIIEKGSQSIEIAKRRLQQALFAFDRSAIYTIHGFCSRILREYAFQSNLGAHSQHHTNSFPDQLLRQTALDFFKTEYFSREYSVHQLSVLFQNDPDQSQLLTIMKKGIELETYPSFPQIFTLFQEAFLRIKNQFRLTSEKMIKDFENLAPCFRKAEKFKETKEEIVEKTKRFCQIFDKETLEIPDIDIVLMYGESWILSLEPELQKKTLPSLLHYPGLTQTLKKELYPLIQMGGHFPFLLARVANDCLHLLKRYQKKHESLFPDDLLKQMSAALNNPEFEEKIRSRYHVALIDEFQDTDPIQWNIFRRLFLNEDKSWNGFIYLVGDPKQSIYSFRQADIYTYLRAAGALGNDRIFSLDTNFRSHVHLIDALNTLFQSVSDWINLPKTHSSLPYHPVKPSKTADYPPIADVKGALHFFIGHAENCSKSKLETMEHELYFPFIVREINSLICLNRPLESMTVLVRDRHQATRLTRFLTHQSIPCISQRGISLSESPILKPFQHLLEAISNPDDLSLIKTALCSPLVGFENNAIKTLSASDEIVSSFKNLHKIWYEEGFSALISSLLSLPFCYQNQNLVGQLLTKKNGKEWVSDLLQIIDQLLEAHQEKWIAPELISIRIEELFLRAHPDETTKRQRDPLEKGVNIITLHYSKGLEFDIVFALGLINPVKNHDILIPVENENRLRLSANPKDESMLAFMSEIDAEKMRQLYVAMTRAKSRLYVPLAINLSESVEVGEASPMDLFLEKWKKRSAYSNFTQFLDEVGSQHHMTYSILKPEEIVPTLIMNAPIPNKNLQPPPKLQFSFPNESLHTFSNTNEKNPVSFASLHRPENNNKDIYTLPAGPETGILLHQILEKAPLNFLKNADQSNTLLSYLQPFVQDTPFEEWIEVIAQLVQSPFQHELLKDVEENMIYRELPFLFPIETANQRLYSTSCLNNGYIKGVVDAIFMHQGHYYVLDWKTNHLGYLSEDYKKEKLSQAIHRENYWLQAEFYTEALRRYLSIVDNRPFADCFGGVIFCFLRGLEEDQHKGFFHVDPTHFSLYSKSLS